MKALLSALALAAALTTPAAANAMDLDVTYRPTTTGATDVEWTFHDIKKGELPQITVVGPDGAPVRIALKVTSLEGDNLVAQANFYKIKTNIYGKEKAELFLQQEMKTTSGKSAGAKVVLSGNSSSPNAFTLKLAPKM